MNNNTHIWRSHITTATTTTHMLIIITTMTTLGALQNPNFANLNSHLTNHTKISKPPNKPKHKQ
jgi:hypothetical protein